MNVSSYHSLDPFFRSTPECLGAARRVVRLALPRPHHADAQREGAAGQVHVRREYGEWLGPEGGVTWGRGRG